MTQQFSPLLFAIPASDETLAALHTHLCVKKARYRNMHLRESDKTTSTLLHLHAIYAKSDDVLVGMASGPGFFVQYDIQYPTAATPAPARALLRVLPGFIGTHKALLAFASNFEKRILARIGMEQDEGERRPRYKKGAFYLKRGIPGSKPNSRGCKSALSAGVLAPAFVSELFSWNLRVLNPQLLEVKTGGGRSKRTPAPRNRT